MEREFKDSGIEWIGRIPKEWKIFAIKHLMTLYAGATPKSDKDELWDGSIPWVTPADYKTEDVYVSKGRRNISAAGLSSCATTLLPINSIIFSKRAPIGLVVLNNVPLCTNQGCIGCVPYKNKANSKYYYYVLSVFTEQFELYGSGTTFKEISANNFANFIVSVPPLPEQQRIADYLDKKCGEIDELIALQEQMIAQLTDYKQSVITEAVTKGLNPDVEFVPSGIDYIGDIPKNWNGCAPLKRFTEIILGKMLQSNASNNDETMEQYICAKDVHFDGIDYSDLKRMYFSNYEKKQYKVHKGDMLVVEGGAGAAGSAIVEKDIQDVYIQNSIMIVRPLNDFSIKFSRYVLFSIVSRGYVDYICNKATIPHFTKEKLSGTIIPIPPVSEQHAIATYLDTKCSEIDSLIAIKQQKIETLKDYKKSVIYEAVTGKMTIGETP